MEFHIIRKRLILSSIILVLAFMLFVFVSYAWFTGVFQESFSGEVGFVQADIDAYFDDGQGGKIPAQEVEIAPGVYKPGVYQINIVSSSNPSFFEDFRLYINVYSNIDTYLRVKIIEQLTLTYTDYLGNVTELSILNNEYMPFDYDLTNWYDNRTIDNYMYYKNPVQRVNASTPTEIGLIPSYFTGQNFSTYAPGYTLQIAFSIEAVQASGGPEHVWGLSTPPWGGNW